MCRNQAMDFHPVKICQQGAVVCDKNVFKTRISVGDFMRFQPVEHRYDLTNDSGFQFVGDVVVRQKIVAVSRCCVLCEHVCLKNMSTPGLFDQSNGFWSRYV